MIDPDILKHVAVAETLKALSLAEDEAEGLAEAFIKELGERGYLVINERDLANEKE
jgi:hypothetical protein